MKGFLLLNSIIIIFVTIVKLTFKRDRNIPYDKEISRFQGLKRPDVIKGSKARHGISERYGFRQDFALFLLFIFVWLGWQLYAMRNIADSYYRAWFIFVGVQAIILMFFALFEPKLSQDMLQNYDVIVTIPVYNEDPESLLSCIASIVNQSVKPKEVHIMDDGSQIDYNHVKKYFYEKCEQLGIYGTWHRQINQGKRHAQINALQYCLSKKETSIVLTVDSDGLLSTEAIKEGLKPFSDKRVQSVAGLVVSKQANHNLLSKITDLIFVMQQLLERGALSSLGCVTVNSGAIAFYRYRVIEKALSMGYLEESFAHDKVNYSDDSYLTLIALTMGKTVAQKSAVCFADMPISFNHHYRQQLRWMRGSFIRGMWRIRFTPINSITFWKQTVGWMSFFSALYIYTTALINLWRLEDLTVFYFIIPFVFMAYLINIKYLKIKRNDMNFKEQFLIYLLSPVAFLWSNIVIRAIKIIAIVTIMNNQWGTRSVVEAVS